MSTSIEIEGSAYWSAWLRQWRIWLIGAVLGLGIAWLTYLAFPPAFRAQATVVVDQNVEEAWTYFPDRQLFHFLNRESNRLIELAWSDQVLGQVASDNSSISISELRTDLLDLSQPADGGWHFLASHDDAAFAVTLANDWSLAFLNEIATSIESSPNMMSARQDLQALLASDPDSEDPQLLAFLAEIMALAEEGKGVSPFVEAYLAQEATVSAYRSVSLPTYLLIGSLAGMLMAFILSLVRASALESKAQ